MKMTDLRVTAIEFSDSMYNPALADQDMHDMVKDITNNVLEYTDNDLDDEQVYEYVFDIVEQNVLNQYHYGSNLNK